MKYIQNIVQTNNEKRVSYIMLGLALSVVVLFVVYLSMMFQVTNVAYAISAQEKEASTYIDQVAVLENQYHSKKRTLSSATAFDQGFAKIGRAQYVSVNRQTYSLAR